MIRYLKVSWLHEFDDEPVMMLSEIEHGREVRKVEKFADGHVQFAGPGADDGDILLSEVLMPTGEEIAEDPQFTVHPISADEFEAEWRAAVKTRTE